MAIPSSPPSSHTFSDDMHQAQKTLLSRDSTYSPKNHQLRRRTSSKRSPQVASFSRQQSLSRDISHAAAETFLMTRLAFKLLGYLGVGYRWISKLLALGLYAILLMPGFLQVGYYYFFSSQVRRSIVYGDLPRNRLDLYLPKNMDSPKPVVAFVTGGAWIIGYVFRLPVPGGSRRPVGSISLRYGCLITKSLKSRAIGRYKAWGSLLGQQLAERDIIVACIDYRNFPQGTISDMVKDASQGISFVCNNIVDYGGDPSRIYLMGQSAGAHIASCALLEQAIRESKGASISWSVSQIKAYFGLSGGYNMTNLVDHFHGRGLYRSIFLSIMEGEESLQKFSPEIVIQDPSIKAGVSILPHIVLFHGTADISIPHDSSKTFVDALRRVGAEAELILYDGKTHTDLILQDPMRGGKDELFEYISAFIHADDEEALAQDAMAPPRRRLVPELLFETGSHCESF